MALNRVSSYGTLVGLDLPPASRNMELKPYTLARATTDNLRVPPVSGDLDGEFGGDFKYGVTANMTADLTVNTDFAQVEVDEQQVNLTRFSLFLPEKRDFFLEGRGNFDFARGGAGGGFSQTASDTPTLFYSRRIGLNRGRVDSDRRRRPPHRQGRGSWGIGAVNIQADDEEIVAHRVDQLHGAAGQARHPAAQHHRRDLHEPIGRRERRPCRARTRPTVSTRRSRSTRTSPPAPTTRAPTPTGSTATTRAIRAASSGCPTATARGSSTRRWAAAFNPEIGFLRRTNFEKT